MALTIAWEGTGVIANATTAEDTAADWKELGGGTIGANPDVYIYGSESIGNKYATKTGYSYFHVTNSGTALNFGSGGNQENELIYIWLNIAAGGAFDTLANKGFAIRVGTDTSNYREWIIAGNDDTNGWTGGWKLFVIDPTSAGSVTDTGTYNTSSITTIGVWIDTSSSVRADSIFIDQIAVASGLRVTGTSTTAWKDVVDYCTDYTNRAWGIVQEYEGVYLIYGKIYIGDSTQTAITQFKDSGRVIQFGETEFWHSNVNGHSFVGWESTLGATEYGIIIDDATGFRTEYEDGVIVGTDNGRAGSTLVGNTGQNVNFDASSLTHVDSYIKLYGTKFDNFRGGIKFFNDANCEIFGCVFTKSGQVDPVGAPKIRNCIFSATQDNNGTAHGAALLWNSNIDVRDCQFIANVDGGGTYHAHGIEHSASGSFTYYGLFFTGNDQHILHTDSGTLAITVDGTAGGNVDNAEITNSGGGSSSVSNPITLTLSGLETNSEIRILQTGTNTDATVTDSSHYVANSGTTHAYNYTYPPSGYTAVDIFIVKPGFEWFPIYNYTLTASSTTIPIDQKADRNYIT